ncbi:MAG: hypothetical protein ABJA71_10890 [Ginsengibacter sp.]
MRALVRKGSEHKLPLGCEIVIGDALSAASYQNKVAPSATFIHLIGVPHPSPSKKEQFKKIDLVSIKEAVKAVTDAGIAHFIYLSVSMYPTKIMNDFQQIRAEGERCCCRPALKHPSFVHGMYWGLDIGGQFY